MNQHGEFQQGWTNSKVYSLKKTLTPIPVIKLDITLRCTTQDIRKGCKTCFQRSSEGVNH